MKKNFFIFNFIPSWLIILLPIFLITGSFLSDLAVSLVAILFFINSLINKLRKYFENYYFKFFCLFWVILIVSSLLSNNVIISLKSSLFYFRFGFFSLCFWYLLDQNKNLIKYLFISLLVCFSSLIIDGYIQYFFGKNLLGFELYNKYRVSSFFGSELILGSYLARFFPILFALFIYLDDVKKNKLTLFFITIVFILSEGLIFLSGERLALFFMNLSAIFIILMIKNYRLYRLLTYLISLLLIIVMINVFPNAKERIIDQTINDFTRGTFQNNDSNDDKLYIFSKPHNDMYTSAYRIFLDNKFFGVGPRQFRNECENYFVSSYSCENHPHNTYMELLSETGIFAFLIVAFLFLSILFISLKHFVYKIFFLQKGTMNDFQICLISAILISLWPFSPSGSFFNNWMSIVYYFPAGILLWEIFKYKKPIKK